MRKALSGIALLGGAAAFGAAGLSLALLGLGLPFLVAALLAAACAGLLIYALGRWALARSSTVVSESALEQRVHELETRTAALRHELRGVLSPALMVSDRLLKNEDPAVRRAGQAVVRSVERATALIVKNKQETGAAIPEAPPDPAELPHPQHLEESASHSPVPPPI